MTALEILNVHAHNALSVARAESRDRHFVQIVLGEFDSVAAHFPILFCKNAETGAFYAGAMLGLKPDENLVADSADRDQARRLLDVVREGFYVSDENIAIDRAHPRFTSGMGEPMFEADGTPAPVLRGIQRALGQLHAGVPHTEQFLARLLALKLVEPIDLSFNFDDGERLAVEGLYTISRDTLADLDDRTVLELFRTGDLSRIYAVILSVQHVHRLARLRNDRIA
ncbi:SapC family protein [Sphingomonas sp. PAMC 26617]|uniref:SapC family protein n=1 Tax=Sphingomonas sp. PAMC 26617 TaxID=1112216 RepID=UPI000289DD1F|nr:SapC family protein [Sphingomonas sp. PAMC 26617]